MMKTLRLGGVAIFAVATIGFLANLTAILGWLGLSPESRLASFQLEVGCNNNSKIASSADEAELQNLSDFFGFVEDHKGQNIVLDFVLKNDGANGCARVDDLERQLPNYEFFPGAIFISEFDAEPAYHSSEDQQYISNVIDKQILQIEAFWPGQWGLQQTVILPQVRELSNLPGYTTGDRFCTRCFSGVFEVNSLAVPASDLYAVRTPRD